LFPLTPLVPPEKEDINRKKHGYSLESAVHLLERYVLPIEPMKPHAVRDAFTENGEEFVICT
jgi:hypothetical protein